MDGITRKLRSICPQVDAPPENFVLRFQISLLQDTLTIHCDMSRSTVELCDAVASINPAETLTMNLKMVSTAGDHISPTVWTPLMSCGEACGDRVEVLVFAGAGLCCSNGGEMAAWLQVSGGTVISNSWVFLDSDVRLSSTADVQDLSGGRLH